MTMEMDIKEYKKLIEKKEFLFLDKDKKYPTTYYYIQTEDTDVDLPKLNSTYVDLSGGYKNCHIIVMEKEDWVGYYDTRDESVIIEDGYFYDGLSKEVMEWLAKFLKWKSYKVYSLPYDYEESVLVIRKEDK